MIETKLDQLYVLREKATSLNKELEDKVNALIPPEIFVLINSVKDSFNKRIADVTCDITELEGNIKQAVVDLKQSFKGEYLQVVYMKGRVSWDDSGLNGYAINHPEIKIFRKQGEPSASIRKVAEK